MPSSYYDGETESIRDHIKFVSHIFQIPARNIKEGLASVYSHIHICSEFLQIPSELFLLQTSTVGSWPCQDVFSTITFICLV